MEHEYIRHTDGLNITCFLVTISNRIPHLHRDMELLLLLRGSVIIKVAGGQHLLKENDFFIIGRNEIHSLVATNENNLILALQFDVNFCKSYFPNLSRTRFLVRHIIREEQPDGWLKLRTCIKDIIGAYSGKQFGYPLTIMSSLNSLCFTLFDLCKTEDIEDSALALEERQANRLSRIVEYIHENYADKISLMKLAQKENLDMYYLSHFIHDSLGISFQQYLNRVRAEKAARLLLSSNKRKIDICLETGFSDYRYLSKAFLKEYGCSPADFKAQYQKDAFQLQDLSYDDQHFVAGLEAAYDRIMEYIN